MYGRDTECSVPIFDEPGVEGAPHSRDVVVAEGTRQDRRRPSQLLQGTLEASGREGVPPFLTALGATVLAASVAMATACPMGSSRLFRPWSGLLDR